MLRHRTIGLGGAVLGALMAANGIFGGLLEAGGTLGRFRETYRVAGQRPPAPIEFGLTHAPVLAAIAVVLGAALLVGGLGLLRNRSWARHVLRVALAIASLGLGAIAAGMEPVPAAVTLGFATGGLVLVAVLGTRRLASEIDRAGWTSRREELEGTESVF